MAAAHQPMTLESLVSSVEPEPGTEPVFCPVRGLPVKRGFLARTLPGFHVLSLEAGKEALARGKYEAFGKSFVCEGLEYLHTDDKIFICEQDNKAFLNHMSMRYHQYIRHELEERKQERRRMRERAEERKARSERHRQQPEREVQSARSLPTANAGQAAASSPAKASSASQAPGASKSAASSLKQSKAKPGDAPEGAQPAQAAQEDPYLDTPMVKAEPEPTDVPVPTDAVPATQPRVAPIAQASPAAVPAPAPVPPPRPAAPVAALPKPLPPVTAVKREVTEDLYGDIGESESKKQKTGSSYANAMSAMLGGDFEDDEI
eukprot:TRINITY_DN103115_c0_g1_i1.p1 TRINITY_DN103115_c0_g1~~TRINITY_DN103115_c0_g1_i1.p1  ORF type:complete len:319 (-),score=84.00 TRINITY_DN103115_c0_g1_i1:36-992(-)